MARTTRRERRHPRWFLFALLPALAFWFAPPPALADRTADARKEAKSDPLDNEPASYLRFVEDGKGGGQLQVAIGTYKNDDGVTVHLVGAVHIGEQKYYEDLAKTMDKYDVVLYEMVKPANSGAPVRGGRRSTSMITMFQKFLTDVLELNFQLEAMDYGKKNFVHADLDAETFAKLQEERGESMLGLMLSQMMKEMVKNFEGKGGGKAQEVGLLELIEAFDSPDRARQFKLILGRSFGDMEEQMAGLNGTVLLTERNKKAISVLKETIRGGKKEIGVFYGAAHMPDLESRLALMGFKRTGMEWRTAWDMTTKPAAGAEKPGPAEKQ